MKRTVTFPRACGATNNVEYDDASPGVQERLRALRLYCAATVCSHCREGIPPGMIATEEVVPPEDIVINDNYGTWGFVEDVGRRGLRRG